MRTTNHRDLLDQIATALGEHRDSYDADAIATSIIDRYDLVDIDTIASDEFWGIVAEHELTPTPDPVDALTDSLSAAIAAAPVGQAAVWHSGTGVTITVRGAARARARQWPQVEFASVTITTPRSTLTMRGDEVASWSALWQMATEELEEWQDATDEALRHVAITADTYGHAQRTADRARQQRDAAIVAAARQGVTAYRIAHQLGVAESTIGRILARHV